MGFVFKWHRILSVCGYYAYILNLKWRDISFIRMKLFLFSSKNRKKVNVLTILKFLWFLSKWTVITLMMYIWIKCNWKLNVPDNSSVDSIAPYWLMSSCHPCDSSQFNVFWDPILTKSIPYLSDIVERSCNYLHFSQKWKCVPFHPHDTTCTMIINHLHFSCHVLCYLAFLRKYWKAWQWQNCLFDHKSFYAIKIFKSMPSTKDWMLIPTHHKALSHTKAFTRRWEECGCM